MNNFAKVVESDPIDLIQWLRSQPLFPKLYFKCPKTGIETLALGSVLTFSQVPAPINEKIFGILPFARPRKTPLWNDLPSGLKEPFFFLPQVEVQQSCNSAIFKIRKENNLIWNIPKKLEVDDCLELIQTKREDSFCYPQWKGMVEEIFAAIDSKKIVKAVLARCSSFPIKGKSFDWLQALIDLSHKQSKIFAFQSNPSSLFLGATPETLYERKGNIIQTESIAGTCKRGSSPLEDLNLGSRLLESSKDQYEFRVVEDFLNDSFSSLCENHRYLQKDHLIKTSHLLHRYSSLEGNLKKGISDIDILYNLFPTPAVEGFPKSLAKDLILNLEPSDRGLYSGALGWISQSESFFAVTIRSALIREERLHAFSGAGIVKGSDPLKEWYELEDKIAHWKTLCNSPAL